MFSQFFKNIFSNPKSTEAVCSAGLNLAILGASAALARSLIKEGGDDAVDSLNWALEINGLVPAWRSTCTTQNPRKANVVHVNMEPEHTNSPSSPR